MNKTRKIVVTAGLVFAVVFGFISNGFVYAAEGNTVDTIFWGNLEDGGTGCGVFIILNDVVDFLTYGVGITAVISLVVFGIKYMTAGGNEQQMLKVKRRALSLLIGVVAYAVSYAGLNFLLPAGKLNPSSACSATVTYHFRPTGGGSGSQGADDTGTSGGSGSPGGSSTGTTAYKKTPSYKKCMKKAHFKNESVRESVCKLEKTSDRIAKTAELLAASSKSASRQCYPLTRRFSKWSQFKRCAPTKNYQYALDKVYPGHWKRYSGSVKNLFQTGASCDIFVGVVVQTAGYDSIGLTHDPEAAYLAKAKKKWKKVSKPSRGDVCISGGHVKIYLGNNKIAEASSGIKSGDKRWGGVTKGNCKGFKVYHAIK